MPAVLANSKVLVSGASGFIAAHVCETLLQRGHSVRGTVRSADKGDYLKKLFSKYGDKFEYVIVEDLEKENGFDEAVKGIDGVMHTASPFHFKVEDAQKDLVNPAVNGTQSILKSIQKNGGSVKRVVLTSSFASVVVPVEAPHTFTAETWNDFSPKELEKNGAKTAPMHAYRGSKVLAERAAWDFVEAHQPRWDLATILPPLVYGPVIHQVPSKDKLNESVSQFWRFVEGEPKDLGPGGNFVDVRDVALAHVEALVRSDAGGQRFATSGGPFAWQDTADALHKLFPGKTQAPVGHPGKGKEGPKIVFDATKTTEVLGIQFRGFEEVIKAMTESVWAKEAAGWDK